METFGLDFKQIELSRSFATSTSTFIKLIKSCTTSHQLVNACMTGQARTRHTRYQRSALALLQLPVVVMPTTSAFLIISKSSMSLMSFSRLAPSSNCTWNNDIVRRYSSATSTNQRRYRRQRSLRLKCHTFFTCRGRKTKQTYEENIDDRSHAHAQLK